MAKPVVLDNTVLSNFALVGRADLVKRLWAEAAGTTQSVMDEHLVGVKSGRVPGGSWTDLAIIELTEEERATRGELPSRLGAGESTCLAVARHRQRVLVTDDLHARKIARKMGIPTTGTVGVLALSVKQGLMSLDEGNRLLKQMIEQNYRSPVEELDDLL